MSAGHSTNPESGAELVEKESVQISKLCADRNASTVFLKIDAEGEELNILKDIIQNDSPESFSGYVEVHEYKMDEYDRFDVTALFDEWDINYQCVDNPQNPNRRGFSYIFWNNGTFEDL